MSQPSLSDQPPRTHALREFESAWKLVVAGSPRVEAYLDALPETEREAARQALEQIGSGFRALLEKASHATPGRTVDPAPGAAPRPAAGGTDESQGVVIVAGGTVDESKGVPFVPGTVDESQGRPLPVPAGKTGGRPVVPGYAIHSELGRGGMGVVYKARHLKLDRVVALKMILGGAHVEEAQLARFHTEAQAVARLQHPGVVQVFEISEHDGLPYFSLEYVEGGSLAKKINRSPQPPAEAARLVEPIARAVQAAHEKNIVHRDLKPANVLLTPDGQPKVTDFGLARRLEGDSGQTRSGSVLGTPSYMAPEQARGDVESVGPLADVYALGAILYEMLTGRPPFQGANVLETLEQVESKEPVPPVQLAPRVPKDLDTICLKCLQKDPARRYQSAGEVADDLRRFTEGRPIVARPVSRAERLWRLCRRNPVTSSLTAAVAVLLLAAGAGGLIGTFVFKVLRDQAVVAERGAVEEKERAVVAEKEAVKEKEKAEKEKAKAEMAEKAEKAERENADRFALAGLSVLRSNVLGIKDKLKGKRELVDLRKQLLRVVLEDVELLSKNLRYRTIKGRTTAAAHLDLGELYVEMGEFSKSKPHLDAGEEILARLADEDGENAVAKRNLANVNNRQAEVALRMGEGPAALARLEKGLRLRQQWHRMLSDEKDGKRVPAPSEDRPPATAAHVHEARVTVAQQHGLLGRASLMLGDARSAIGHYARSQENYDAVPPEHYQQVQPVTKRLDYLAERNHLKRQLGKCYEQLGQTAEARKYLKMALDERVSWVGAMGERTPPSFRHAMIQSRWDVGDLILIDDGDPLTALPYYRSAALSAAALSEKEPKNLDFSHNVALAEYRLGYAHLRAATLYKVVASAGWAAAAQAHFDKARQLMEPLAAIDPADTRMQALLALSEARCGMPTEAAGRARAMQQDSPNDSRVLYHAACVLALAAAPAGDERREADLDAALKTLETAVDKGWRDAAALRREPDLDPLRGRPRLDALVRRLADPAKR